MRSLTVISILEASSFALEVVIVTTVIVHPVAIVSTSKVTLLIATSAAAAASSLLVLLWAIFVVEAGWSVLTVIIIANLLVES